MNEKPVYCSYCSNDYDYHTYIPIEEIEILRSQGCGVLLCDSDTVELGEITMDLTHIGVRWAYIVSSDGTPLTTKAVYARCKTPGNPCDVEHMLEISS
jgi:hypothetical protein